MSRVAIVADASWSVAPAICHSLHNEGYQVVSVHAISNSDLEASTETENKSVRRWNTASLAACAAGVGAAEAEFGPIAVLVNCSLPIRSEPFMLNAAKRWRSTLSRTIGSYFNMTKAVWPGMQSRNYGRILNVAWLEGQTGSRSAVASSAAMAAVRGFTKSLAHEGGSHGVTANTLAVGDIWDEQRDAETKDVRARQIPMGRLGEPHDVGRAVAFLCSEHAGYITGSTLSINGGAHMF